MELRRELDKKTWNPLQNAKRHRIHNQLPTRRDDHDDDDVNVDADNVADDNGDDHDGLMMIMKMMKMMNMMKMKMMMMMTGSRSLEVSLRRSFGE